MPGPVLEDLHAPYELTPEQVAYYQRNGFIRLKDVLSPETLAYFAQSIQQEASQGPAARWPPVSAHPGTTPFLGLFDACSLPNYAVFYIAQSPWPRKQVCTPQTQRCSWGRKQHKPGRGSVCRRATKACVQCMCVILSATAHKRLQYYCCYWCWR
jgi:hypothetical protein